MTKEMHLREWLSAIWAVSLDCDGCNTVEDLVKLVNEINEMAKSGMDGEDSPYILWD